MVTKAENELLTRVGPDTPCGELLRQYWMPVAPAAELTAEKPKKRIRVMGENLVLFRDGQGRYGLVEEQCRHRRTSLYYGFIEDDGLRCPYHGWKFDVSGRCLEQPFEPKGAPPKPDAAQKAYPVQMLSGMLFAWMGKGEPPLLPRWETLVRRDGTRSIMVLPVHRCNWLQCQENSVDPTHTYYLHGHTLKLMGGAENDRRIQYYYRPIENYDFQLCEEKTWTGIRKIRTYGGDRPETETGHPMIFPNVLMNPQGPKLVTHWRVPIDDQNTYIIMMEFTPSRDGAIVDQPDSDIATTYVPDPYLPNGEYRMDDFPPQDQMAWETQGAIYDRSEEYLGHSDKGIVMFRRLLKRQIEQMQAGHEPAGLFRDESLNECISFSVSTGQRREALKAEERSRSSAAE
jgi:5,5'-dehydrodivanillate O-demethylase